MKRKAVATEHIYRNGQYTHHCGPVSHLEKRDKCSFTVRTEVNVKRFNAIQLRRKIWLATNAAYLAMPPKLIKHQRLENNQQITNQ